MEDQSTINWLTIIIAGYAAIVATGALALEVRRWFESGPRLSIDLMPEAETINIPGTEGKTYLLAKVSNRGNAPTTIMHFGVCEFRTWSARIRSKADWTAIVPHPHLPDSAPILPSTLQPGAVWTGMARYDDEGDLKRRVGSGKLYVFIYASHTDKPLFKLVRLAPQPPADAQQI